MRDRHRPGHTHKRRYTTGTDCLAGWRFAGRPQTLGQVLSLLLPGTEISEEDEHGVGFPWPAQLPSDQATVADGGAGPGPYIAVVQGVRPSLAAPLQQLWELLHHPDQFIYVSLKPIRQ